MVTRAGGAVAQGPRLLGRRVACPAPSEGTLGQRRAPRLEAAALRHGDQQVEGGLESHLVHHVMIVMFAVGQHQGTWLIRGDVEDGLGQEQQRGRGLRHGARGAGQMKAQRLTGLGVQAEEGLKDLERLGAGVLAMASGLALGVALEAVRIDGQELAAEMPAGTAQFAQRDLQSLGFPDRVGVEQGVDLRVAGDKGQAVGHLEALLTEGAALPQTARTEGGLVHQLQGQAGFDGAGRGAGPTAEQVPGAQAQMLGEQEPETDLVAGDLVGEQLAHLPFQALGVGRFAPTFAAGALGLDRPWRRFGVKGVEFFFAGRNRR